MRSPHVRVAEANGHVIGVVEIAPAGETADLVRLFVEPARLRAGAGRALFDWAKGAARAAGAMTLRIDADPGAAEFTGVWERRTMEPCHPGRSPDGGCPDW